MQKYYTSMLNEIFILSLEITIEYFQALIILKKTAMYEKAFSFEKFYDVK